MIKASYGCIYLGLLMVAGLTNIYAQTCTITGPGPVIWNNASPPACDEGGTTNGKSIIVIPTGVTLVFNSIGDTWTGTRIDVYGTLDITFNVTINSSVSVYNASESGGQARLGTGPGCGYTMIIYTGGTVDVGLQSDRLTVCGADIMKGNGVPSAMIAEEPTLVHVPMARRSRRIVNPRVAFRDHWGTPKLATIVLCQ